MIPTRRRRNNFLTLSGLCLVILLLSGCASGSPTARGYYNEPVRPLTASDGQSHAYLASLHVPWCVSLGDSQLTLDQVRSLRKRFYELSRAHAEANRAAALSPAAEDLSSKTVSDLHKLSCWALVQQTGTRIPGDAHNREIVALALPGGGSRSAVFSAAVMFELQRRDLLREVDLISSVSGGALPAALYARSCEQDAECLALYDGGEGLLWSLSQEERIFDMLTTDFLRGALMKMTSPWNQLRYRTTGHDRTDTMAEVFASTLFGAGADEEAYGMRFRHVNPRRPNVVMNGMNSTGRNLGGGLRGQHFLFTLETFEDVLHSDLHNYPLAFAVVGSGAFPGAFHPLTLAAFPESDNADGESGLKPKYLHIVDGGLYDRLGVEAIQLMLQDITERERPCVRAVDQVSIRDDDDCLQRVSLIILDSGLPFEGEDERVADVRIPVFDLFVNHNIKMASLALLEIQAELRLNALKVFIREQNNVFRRRHGTFKDVFSATDVRLRDVEQCIGDPLPCARAEGFPGMSLEDARRTYQDLWAEVIKVPLSLKISKESAAALRRAARILVHKKLQENCLAGRPQMHCPPTLPRDLRDSLQLFTGSPPR